MVQQDYSDFEVIVADGMSTDQSRSVIHSYMRMYPHVRLLTNPLIRSDYGFNLAVENSRGELIVLLGGHTQIATNFVSTAVGLLESTGADVVGPALETVGHGYIGQAIARVLASPFGTGSRFRYSRLPQFVDTVAFGTYRASLFREFGGFLTDRPKLEDLEFNRRLVRAGKKIYMHPAIQAQYQCQRSLGGFLGKVWGNGSVVVDHWLARPRSVAWRHLAPLMLVLSLMMLACGGLWYPNLMIVLQAELYCYSLLTLVFTVKSASGSVRHLPLILILFPAMHITYGLGGAAQIVNPSRLLARWRATGI